MFQRVWVVWVEVEGSIIVVVVVVGDGVIAIGF